MTLEMTYKHTENTEWRAFEKPFDEAKLETVLEHFEGFVGTRLIKVGENRWRNLTNRLEVRVDRKV